MKKMIILAASIAALSTAIVSCGGNAKSQAEIQDSIRRDSIRQDSMNRAAAEAQVVITDPVCDTLKTADGKMLEITYGSLGDKRVAVLSNSELVANDTLPQTQAWAKGADYEKGSVKLHCQGDKVKLHTEKGEYDLTVQRKK